MSYCCFRYFVLFSLIFFLAFITCERNISPFTQKQAQLTLSAEYIAVTEIWLQVHTENISTNQKLKVWRDTTIVFSGILNSADTTVYDSTLLPAHDYTYYAAIVKNGNNLVESQPLKITTGDTTSHDFNWQIYTIDSPYGSGRLRDVAIISENDIWAVGEIYADSAKSWLPYNAVHWDGQQWELKRIPTNSVVGIGYYPINTIFPFNSDDIWMFSDAGSYSHWNGSLWKTEYVPERQGGITKIWGVSSNDIYFVGTNGNITHYNGSSWQKLESGTELNINDIWGSFDQKTSEYEVLCVASNHLSDPTYSRKILKIKQNQAIDLSSYPIQWTLYSTWFIPQGVYFVSGSGIYERHNLTELQWQNGTFDITQYYIYRIRGNDSNDLIAVGGFGEVVHFNGMSWQSFFNETQIDGNYYSVAVKDDIVAAVGYDSQNAVISMGHMVDPMRK